MRRWILLAGFALLVTPRLWAVSGTGTTAATFLKIGLAARPVAMGEAFTAVADDPSALQYNPAGLEQLTAPEFNALHVFWLGDQSLDYVSAAYPLPVGVLAMGLEYLNLGSLSRSDAGDVVGSPDRGSFHADNLAFTAGYGFRYSPALDLGANLKFFSENIDAAASVGWALDLGVLYRVPLPGVSVGFMVQNLGPATQIASNYYRLPLTFRLGAAYHPVEDYLVTADYTQTLEHAGRFALGWEYRYEGLLALRLGYAYQGSIDASELYSGYGANTLSGISAGLGVNYEDFRLDYAFVPYGFLGTTHRLCLTYTLSAARTPSTPVAH